MMTSQNPDTTPTTPGRQQPQPHQAYPSHVPGYQPPYAADDEIDLFELLQTLWRGKWLIIAVTFLFAAAGVAYALWLPNIYQAQALLAPVKQEEAPRISGQLGALAGLAGVSLGGSVGNQATLAKEILRSRSFIGEFIHRHQLAPQLAAVSGWNASTGEWVYDTEKYDLQTGQWHSDKDGKSFLPTEWELVKDFREILAISESKDTGMVTVSIKSRNPVAARDWVSWLVRDVNETMRQRDIAESQRRIEYLEDKIRETSISGMQQVFFQLIESETRTVMLANVQPEYVFTTVDPPVIPEEKSEPKRALICILATLAGGMIAVMLVFVQAAIRSRREQQQA
jgi:uncharacterized protein involved in exopolysaccharide biosynthesis